MTMIKVEKVYKKLGKLIASRRAELSLSQADLAKKIKMSRPSVINMEAGRQRILLHRLMEVDAALGYPKGYLIQKLLRGAE